MDRAVPLVKWDQEPSNFLDMLVDNDERYLDLQRAVDDVLRTCAVDPVELVKLCSTRQFHGKPAWLHKTPRIQELPTAWVTFVLLPGLIVRVKKIEFDPADLH